MIAVDVPRECLPSRATVERIRGAAKNGRPRRLRCKGKTTRAFWKRCHL